MRYGNAVFVEHFSGLKNTNSNRKALIYLDKNTDDETSLSYQELHQQSFRLASYLRKQHLVGKSVLLLYPSSIDYVVAFFGCLYAGVVSVPAYPPKNNHHAVRLKNIIEDASVEAVLCSEQSMESIKKHVKVDRYIATDTIVSDIDNDASIDNDVSNEPDHTVIDTDNLVKSKDGSEHEVAYLQYTSGSTSSPKGVMVSQRNMLVNCEIFAKGVQTPKGGCHVSWLPLFHDMGLVEGILLPLSLGATAVFMAPERFVQQPIRWLRALSDYKAVMTGGPNFAYDLCVQRTSAEQRAGLDLSALKVALNGAEPVVKSTLDKFSRLFEEHGFCESAHFPAYGLAEATLVITTGDPGANEPKCIYVDEQVFKNNSVKVCQEKDPGSKAVVSSGLIASSPIVEIVNPDSNKPVGNCVIGEIWAAGPSICSGYWGKAETTKARFHGLLEEHPDQRFLKTGDLGFIHEGQLFVTGRIDDLIIIRGENHYPQDIEHTVENLHPALRRGGFVSAFTVQNGDERANKLVIVQEVERTQRNKIDVAGILSMIRKAVFDVHGLNAHDVVLVQPGEVLKTSSGKVQRSACRIKYKNDSFKRAKGGRQVTETGGPSDQVSSVVGDARTPGDPLLGASMNAVSGSRANTASESASADELVEWLREYAGSRINSYLIDERRCIPPYIVLDFGNKGLMGMQVSKRYGGLGLRYLDVVKVYQQLAAIDLTLATFVGLNNYLGIWPIEHHATDEKKEDLLPLLATGRELAAFAITEPGAGSSPNSIQCVAAYDGISQFKINGSKSWIGSGSWSSVINVFAKTVDTEDTAIGMSGFTLRQGTPGLSVASEAMTMGMRGMVQNSVSIDNLHASSSCLLGSLGNGMMVARDVFQLGRFMLSIISLGGMKRCVQLLHRYAARRSIGTGRLLDNPVTRWRIFEMRSGITLVENFVQYIAAKLDQGDRVSEELYLACKITAPEFLWRACDGLMQTLGGRGYIDTNIASQLLRDARLIRIFEGPTETLSMHLGSKILNDETILKSWISDDLQSPRLYDRFHTAFTAIELTSHANQSSDIDRVASKRWAQVLIGELAALTILEAVTSFINLSAKQSENSSAVEWVNSEFDRIYRTSLEKIRCWNSVAVSHSKDYPASDSVSQYTNDIGDIQQAMAGESHDLDSYLHIDLKGNNQIDEDRGSVSFDSERSEENVDGKRIDSSSGNGSQDPSSNVGSSTHSVNATHSVNGIQSWLTQWVCSNRNISLDFIQPEMPFSDYGMDSISVVELVEDLEKWLQLDIDTTIVWNYSNIDSLSNFLIKRLQPRVGVESNPPRTPELDILSEDEIRSLLMDELAETGGV